MTPVQLLSPQSKKPKAALGQMPVGVPLHHLAIDFVGPLPESKKGNCHILVVTDHFTKWVEIFALADQKAETCVEVLLNEVIARLGCPLSIHSDQGRNFESQVFSELCLMLEIRKTQMTPGNPRCNGEVEHFNKTWMIKYFLKGEKDQWDKHLGCLAGAYHWTHHQSTGFSPNLMMLGREVWSPTELHFGSTLHKAYSTYGQFVTKLKETLQHVHMVA